MSSMKSIAGFPDYSIDDTGSVWSVKTNRLLKPSCTKDGYMQVILRLNKKSYCKRIHRLVAENFLKPPVRADDTVNHIDGNKTNNSYKNLEWLTRVENIKHSCDIGVRSRRLTVEQLVESGVDKSTAVYAKS